MWNFILCIIAFFLLRFLWDCYQQNLEVARQGGMAIKYQELIRLLRMGYTTVTVRHVTANSITYAGRISTGTLFFTLTQTFGKVTVDLGTDHPMLGRNANQYVFGELEDQQWMYAQISADIHRKAQAVISELDLFEF